MKKFLKIIFLILVIGILGLIIYRNKDIFLKKIYPVKYVSIINQYSKEYEVDKYLIFAIIKAESNFDENAVSSKGAKGLMQLIDSTAKEVAKEININFKEEDILDPNINIKLGTKYISNMLKKYTSIELALAAYNAGTGNVDNWIKQGNLKEDGSNWENIPYKETKSYVKKILTDYDIYKNLYKEEG